MSVRQKAYDTVNVASVTTLAPGGVLAAGSVSGAIAVRPYVVYRGQLTQPDLHGDDEVQSSTQTVAFWVYDDPGSYTNIEAVIEEIKTLMAAATGLRSRWTNTSQELSDDEQKAILKNVVFQCTEVQ